MFVPQVLMGMIPYPSAQSMLLWQPQDSVEAQLFPPVFKIPMCFWDFKVKLKFKDSYSVTVVSLFFVSIN